MAPLGTYTQIEDIGTTVRIFDCFNCGHRHDEDDSVNKFNARIDVPFMPEEYSYWDLKCPKCGEVIGKAYQTAPDGLYILAMISRI